MEIMIVQAKEWLRDLKHKQLTIALCNEKDHNLDKTVLLFETILFTLEDNLELESFFYEKINLVKEESYDDGYKQAIQDVLSELDIQDVDDEILSAIEEMY